MALGYDSNHQATMADTSPRTASPQPSSHRLSRSFYGFSTNQSKRSSRVEKPRSIHNSPSVMERRKTTSSVKKYVGLDDHWEAMFGSGAVQDREDNTTRNRPVSWHPASTYYPDSFVSSPADDLSCQNGTYGFPDQASPYPSSSALAYISAIAERKRNYPPSSMGSPDVSMDTTPFPAWQDPCSPESTFVTSFPTMTSQPMQQNWGSMAPPTSHPQVDSGSPEFLPTRNSMDTEDDSDCMVDEPSEEPETVLVGMGLYDPPSYESMLTSGLGKGLKLEETWQPPSETDGDDDDDEDEDADVDADDESSESEESVEELPAPQAVEDSHQNWTMHPAQSVTSDMSGQSFFLEGDETYTNEWWYQQLKRPTAQDAGLGYGWLHQTQC